MYTKRALWRQQLLRCFVFGAWMAGIITGAIAGAGGPAVDVGKDVTLLLIRFNTAAFEETGNGSSDLYRLTLEGIHVVFVVREPQTVGVIEEQTVDAVLAAEREVMKGVLEIGGSPGTSIALQLASLERVKADLTFEARLAEGFPWWHESHSSPWGGSKNLQQRLPTAFGSGMLILGLKDDSLARLLGKTSR